MENEKIPENKIDEEEMKEEIGDEFYEKIKFLLMIIDAILTVLILVKNDARTYMPFSYMKNNNQTRVLFYKLFDEICST